MTNAIVIDVEATCWQRQPPPGQEPEIIEIGICPYDVTTDPVKSRSILVRPVRSKVSRFCTRLTTLTQAQVDTGILFGEACAILRDEYQTRDHLWLSWGEYDRALFLNQCIAFGVEYPFGDWHLNLKRVYARLEHGGKQVGMARALKHTGLGLVGTHHRAGDDACNVARLLAHLVSKHGLDLLSPRRDGS